MKKTYHLPLTEIIPHIAMERIMEATVISGNKDIDDPGEGPDPGALIM